MRDKWLIINAIKFKYTGIVIITNPLASQLG